MRKVLFLSVFLLASISMKAQDSTVALNRYLSIDLAGPSTYFLRTAEDKTWRCLVGYTHSPFKKEWISLSHSIEFLNYLERFSSYWYYQHPFSPLFPVWEKGKLQHRQFSYIVGAPIQKGFGKGTFGIFFEPGLAFGMRWGRKRQDDVDASRDFVAKEIAISPRLRAGISLNISNTIKLDIGTEFFYQKFMGVGKHEYGLLPVLNLGIRL